MHGRLVLNDNKLVAVLVRLEKDHGEHNGSWFVEAAFGRAADVCHRGLKP
jgi:hypothetical protein